MTTKAVVTCNSTQKCFLRFEVGVPHFLHLQTTTASSWQQWYILCITNRSIIVACCMLAQPRHLKKVRLCFPGGRLSQALLAGSSCIWTVPCSGWTRFWPRWVPRLHAAPVCPKRLKKLPPPLKKTNKKNLQPITWSLNSKVVSPFMGKKRKPHRTSFL